MSRTDIIIRPVEATDLEDIVRIDEKLTGHTRKDYWQTRLEIAALRPPWMSLVAETDGRLVGFLFGWVGESEFGMAGGTGWIDLIGIDPRYRSLGVGRALVERFVASGRELRAIQKVATLIDLTQEGVRDFFVHLGFRHGPMIQLEQPV
jgi:ribosomal protein S18 acetylase RimI-like enzyme